MSFEASDAPTNDPATMLVRSGVGKIRLIDFDQVTLSSLNVSVDYHLVIPAASTQR